MPTHDAIPRLIRSVRGNSTAAPLELFIRIRDELSTLTPGRSLVRAGVPPQTYIDAAYRNMVPLQARTRAYYATFLSIASTAVRHLLTREAQTRLREHPVRLSATSPEVIESTIRDGAALEPRDLKTLLVLDKALDQLEACHALQSQVLEGRFYGTMREDELAEAHNVPIEVVQREAAHGMAWLRRHSMPFPPTVDRLQPPMMRP